MRVSSLLKQLKFLSVLIEKMDNEQGINNVIENLNKVRQTIIQPDRLGLHIAANWDDMARLQIDLAAPWTKLVPVGEVTKKQ